MVRGCGLVDNSALHGGGTVLICLVIVCFGGVGGVGGVAALVTGTPDMAGSELEGELGKVCRVSSCWVILSAQCQFVIGMASSARKVC